MTNRANAWAQRRRKVLINRFGGKCRFCGSVLRLEFAHKQPTELSGGSRGRKERLADISKFPDSYDLLCHDCHVAYDSGYLLRRREDELDGVGQENR